LLTANKKQTINAESSSNHNGNKNDISEAQQHAKAVITHSSVCPNTRFQN